MKKRERLEAAIAGERVDRVPVALWRHWPGDDQRADDLAAAHILFQQTYDWDFVKVSPASSFCLDIWGVEDHWEGNIEGTRRYVSYPVHSPEDWRRIAAADVLKGGLGRQLKCLELLRAAFGEETPFVQTVFSPLAQARHLAHGVDFVSHLRQYPEPVNEALQVITETTIKFISEAKRRGIAGIYYAVQHATYSSLSEAEYAVFGRLYDQQILRAVSDLWLNILHVHGEAIMFNALADYPVQVVNWHDRETEPSIAEGLLRFPGAASGGVSRDVLHEDNPAAALVQARDAFGQTGGRRWILGTGCVTLVTTPTGNLRRLRESVERFVP